jgi:RNA polymerase sigma-70 factor (ECF subfamily)
MMLDTSLSLLDCLRQQPSDASWQRLIELYSPLIRSWLIQRSLLPQDADDVVQEILLVVLRKLPQFEREPRTGAFRRWLLNITINCLREFWRAKRLRPTPLGDEQFLQTLDSLEDPTSDLSQRWDREHDLYVTRVLLERLKPDFEPKTWRAFEMLVFEGMMPARVARELAMTPNAVFIAKSRIMTQLRKLGAGLID